MNKKTYQQLIDAAQLLVVVLSIIILSIVFYLLSELLKPTSADAVDTVRIDSRRECHRTDGCTNIFFF